MGVQPLDISGHTFGWLTALSICGRNKHGHLVWRWSCACGAVIEREAQPIKAGRQVSCGCYHRTVSKPNLRHGMHRSRTYRCWVRMKARALGREDAVKHHYSGRGIGICPGWEESFECFLADMSECPPGLTIERIDNDRGYEKSNCRWATQRDQVRNTRRTVRITVDQRTFCLKDACEILAVSYDRVRGCIRRGMEPQIAVEWCAGNAKHSRA